MLRRISLLVFIAGYVVSASLDAFAQVQYRDRSWTACECNGVNRTTKDRLINNAMAYASNICGTKGVALGKSPDDFSTSTAAENTAGDRCSGMNYSCEIEGTIICQGDEDSIASPQACACNSDQPFLPVCPPGDARCNSTPKIDSPPKLASNAAASTPNCFTEDSKTVTSPDRHCPKNCGGHHNNYGFTPMELRLPKQWKEIGAFYQGAQLTCTGTGCGWMETSAASISEAGSKVTASWKTWGRSAQFTLKARVCKF